MNYSLWSGTGWGQTNWNQTQLLLVQKSATHLLDFQPGRGSVRSFAPSEGAGSQSGASPRSHTKFDHRMVARRSLPSLGWHIHIWASLTWSEWVMLWWYQGWTTIIFSNMELPLMTRLLLFRLPVHCQVKLKVLVIKLNILFMFKWLVSHLPIWCDLTGSNMGEGLLSVTAPQWWNSLPLPWIVAAPFFAGLPAVPEASGFLLWLTLTLHSLTYSEFFFFGDVGLMLFCSLFFKCDMYSVFIWLF